MDVNFCREGCQKRGKRSVSHALNFFLNLKAACWMLPSSRFKLCAPRRSLGYPNRFTLRFLERRPAVGQKLLQTFVRMGVHPAKHIVEIFAHINAFDQADRQENSNDRKILPICGDFRRTTNSCGQLHAPDAFSVRGQILPGQVHHRFPSIFRRTGRAPFH